MPPFRLIAAAALLAAAPALADVPRVAADIAPVHSLVAQVMRGVGAPDLIVTPGASPHGYALRPSQARLLQSADLVVWIGPALTPWLAESLRALAPEARQVELLELPGGVTLGFRDAGQAAHDDHHHAPAAAEGRDHHGHAAPDHMRDGSHDHDAHHRAGRDDHGHDHGDRGLDPHAWLDPENGRVWLGAIAEELAALDPENGPRYRANAAAAQERLDTVTAEIAALVAPVAALPFVTFHDAYRYFDARFGLSHAGSVSLGDATDPSPARLKALRDRLQDGDIRCAFREPQFNDRILHAATEGGAVEIAVLDPVGRDLEPGPDLYAGLLRDMAQSLAECLAR